MLQTYFFEETKRIAKLFEMGVALSSYKEKRKEKKELKRFLDVSFLIFIEIYVVSDWKNNASNTVEKVHLN